MSSATRSRSSSALLGVPIVVVDDEDDVREIVAAIVGNAGAEVTVLLPSTKRSPCSSASTRGGRERHRHAGQGWPRARSCRARLPIVSGGSTPMVALTAFARAKDRIEALAAGFSAHVAKPVEPDERVHVISTLLSRDR